MFFEEHCITLQLTFLIRNLLIRNVGADSVISWPGNRDPQSPGRPFLRGKDRAAWKGGMDPLEGAAAPPNHLLRIMFLMFDLFVGGVTGVMLVTPRRFRVRTKANY